MKLYTEEQLREAFIDGMKFISVHPLKYEQDANEYINSLTPIELPTDKEVEKESGKENFIVKQYAFIRGAKYVIEQIQGGNK